MIIRLEMLKKTVTIIKIIVHLCKMLKHIILFTLATIVVDGNVRCMVPGEGQIFIIVSKAVQNSRLVVPTIRCHSMRGVSPN